jgi:hypothetical protein
MFIRGVYVCICEHIRVYCVSIKKNEMGPMRANLS